MLSSVAYPTLLYHSTLSNKRYNFIKNITEYKMCVLIPPPPQLLSKTFLILRRTERDIIKKVYRSSCKLRLLVPDFNEI